MLEEQTSRPHRSLDFPLAVLIFEPKQDEDMASVHPKRNSFGLNKMAKLLGENQEYVRKLKCHNLTFSSKSVQCSPVIKDFLSMSMVIDTSLCTHREKGLLSKPFITQHILFMQLHLKKYDLSFTIFFFKNDC